METKNRSISLFEQTHLIAVAWQQIAVVVGFLLNLDDQSLIGERLFHFAKDFIANRTARRLAGDAILDG